LEVPRDLGGCTGERGGEYDGSNDDWSSERDDGTDGVDGDGRVALVSYIISKPG
jgi:hypothetical protein